jgi:acetate kinase
MTDAILVINAGSSSLRFAVFARADFVVLCWGNFDSVGGDVALSIGGPLASRMPPFQPSAMTDTHEALTDWVLRSVQDCGPAVKPIAVGHRVVHGGMRFDAPALIDADVLAYLDALVDLAPEHEAHSLAAIRAVTKSWPSLPQVACFDTQFHRTQPKLAQLFAIPHALSDAGMVRYGFHGLSYEYIASVLPEVAGAIGDGKVIVAHLGNGASMCAMVGRRSLATTMSYTPLDGLMMGTRCGSIDPGVILHLIRHKGYSADDVADLLGNKSGLLGVSGISADVRVLEASKNHKAGEAIDLFVYRAGLEIGGLVAALGGLDALVFTGGIGEHSVSIRQRICEQARWMGLDLDVAANASHRSCISSQTSKVLALVIPSNEEIVVARAANRIVMQCT